MVIGVVGLVTTVFYYDLAAALPSGEAEISINGLNYLD